MEINMKDKVIISKRFNISPKEGEVIIPGIERKVYLKEGEILIIPDLFSDGRFKSIKNIHNYVIFENILVINDIISFKAFLVSEVSFFDIKDNVEINRFKIPFEGNMGSICKGIKRVNLAAEKCQNMIDIIERGKDDRLRGLEGLVIAKTSFDVEITAKIG